MSLIVRYLLALNVAAIAITGQSSAQNLSPRYKNVRADTYTGNSVTADTFIANDRVSTPYLNMQSSAPLSIKNLYSNSPDNGVYASGNGAEVSYCPWTGCPGYDVIRAAQLVRFKSRAGYEVGETAVAFDAYLNSGYAGAWAPGRSYAVGEQAIAAGLVYEVTTAGTSASTGTGPSGTGPSITDGSVRWKFVIAAAQAGNNKVGLSETYVVGPNAGQSWGGARNVIMLPGMRAAHVSNTELDFGNLAGSCNGAFANCFGLFRYGNTRYPITAWDVFSTPEGTPEIGVPGNWAPNTPYAITDSGAPVRKNGANYYVLVQSGTSGGSGGPTGTGSGIIDGTAKWDYYKADFTGGVTGGSTYYGILFQGRNNVIRDVINIATWSQFGIRGDAGAKFSGTFIEDNSTAVSSYRTAGTYSYAAWSDASRAPYGIRAEGTYTAGAYRHKDFIIGAWGGDPTYSAVTLNVDLSPGGMNGFFGKTGDNNWYMNTANALAFRVKNIGVGSFNASGLDITGILTASTGVIAPYHRSPSNTQLSLGNASNGIALVVNPATAGSSVANYVRVDGSGSGSGPVIRAVGSDPNIPLNLSSQGASPVQVQGGLAVTGAISSSVSLYATNLAGSGVRTLCANAAGQIVPCN